MKKMLFLVLWLLPCWLSAQTVDSVALRQVNSLLETSRALTDKGEFDKALEVNAAAVKLALEKFGPESSQFGNCCFTHGWIHYYSGNYPEAEKWYVKARAIQEKALGRDSPKYADIIDNLAIVSYLLTNYEKAEQFFLESKEIREIRFGKEHPDYAASLNNLATFYSGMGDYEKVEPLLIEAKDIWKKALGIEHPKYATSLNNLARFFVDIGNYEKAEPLYLEAKAIFEKILGKEHPDYAAILDNLANFYVRIGNYEKAEPLCLEAKSIREETLGKEHPDYVTSLSNLANFYLCIGNYEKAEPLCLETKAITETILGKEHPDYARSLRHLVNFYVGMGNYEKAEPLCLEAKAIAETILGKEHPDYVRSLRLLANLYVGMGAYEKAGSYYQELFLANQSILEKAVHHLSERELGNYLNGFSESQDQVLSFAQESSSKKVAATCFDNSLFYKGFILQAIGQIKRLSIFDSTAAENFNLLKSYERRLAVQYAQPIADRDSAAVAELEASVNDLEKDLARTVASYGQAIQQVKWEQVQAVLKPGEAAIELVSYRFYQKKQTDSTMYAALILLPGTERPQFIPLFEEKQLASLLKTEGKPQPAFYNDLYTSDKKGAQLYDLIWKPIAAALPEGSTVYCSPSGLLHRINLGAIPTPDGKSLTDKYRLTMLSSTRQLIVPQVPASNQNATAQLYGGIEYDATPVIAASTKPQTDDMASRRSLDFTQADSTLRGETWGYLRWTEVEISTAAEILKSKGTAVILKKGAEATEESFKSIGASGPSPRVLHVATHGFFFPDPDSSPTGGGREGADEKVFKVSENPMIRSGLVLAGGNHAWKTGKALRPDLEDGILTAYEISQMNLSNTELVVLSACETGLGDLVGNEGVYGLQRAFKIAGAKYLIMSLWQVPDFQTQVFMTTFYKRWLDDKMDIPEAFRATQSELKAKYGEAFKWAGFVLVE